MRSASNWHRVAGGQRRSRPIRVDLLPSHALAMGGVSIAVVDPLLDPFTNPAKGTRLEGVRFFGAPGLYNVSSEAGRGRSLPLGTLAKLGSWYGGFSFALQQVELSERANFFPINPTFCPTCLTVAGPVTIAERVDETHGNGYVVATLGRDLAAGLSLGGRISWSSLNAVDGVDLLYMGSSRLEQSGQTIDVRLGLLKEWEGDRSFEVLVIHNRLAATHDVLHLDRYWDPGEMRELERPRWEQNLDRTRTWAVSGRPRRLRLSDSGMRPSQNRTDDSVHGGRQDFISLYLPGNCLVLT